MNRDVFRQLGLQDLIPTDHLLAVFLKDLQQARVEVSLQGVVVLDPFLFHVRLDCRISVPLLAFVLVAADAVQVEVHHAEPGGSVHDLSAVERALAQAVKKSGFPPQALDRMETWAAAFILLSNKFRELGLSGGVEGVLRNDFSAKGKNVGELESNLEQLSFFDQLPETAQRALLEGAIEDNKSMNEDFSGMLKAWSRGDVQGIARTFDRDLSSSPALQQSLIRQRNANWSKWIERRMTEPGAVMLAVGAGHLAGKDSVLEMLKKSGYKIRRLQ